MGLSASGWGQGSLVCIFPRFLGLVLMVICFVRVCDMAGSFSIFVSLPSSNTPNAKQPPSHAAEKETWKNKLYRINSEWKEQAIIQQDTTSTTKQPTNNDQLPPTTKDKKKRRRRRRTNNHIGTFTRKSPWSPFINRSFATVLSLQPRPPPLPCCARLLQLPLAPDGGTKTLGKSCWKTSFVEVACTILFILERTSWHWSNNIKQLLSW